MGHIQQGLASIPIWVLLLAVLRLRGCSVRDQSCTLSYLSGTINNSCEQFPEQCSEGLEVTLGNTWLMEHVTWTNGTWSSPCTGPHPVLGSLQDYMQHCAGNHVIPKIESRTLNMQGICFWSLTPSTPKLLIGVTNENVWWGRGVIAWDAIHSWRPDSLVLGEY